MSFAISLMYMVLKNNYAIEDKLIKVIKMKIMNSQKTSGEKDMKIKLFVLSILLLLGSISYAQTEKLTNKSITDMIGLGFSEDIIITKIKTSDADFDTNIEALKDLKSKGVSDKIIVAIMNSKEKQGTVQNKEADNKNGIYIKFNDKYTKILPAVFSGSKTNTLGAAFSYGIASAKIKSIMNNAHSNNVIDSNKPEFWFFFTRKDNDSFKISSVNWWFSSASSPNEFALVRLNSKKNNREMVTGKVNVYSGSKTGIDEKYLIPFDIETIDEYTYKVKPKNPMEDGEYCFFYQGTIPQGGYTNQSVFDFSVKANDQQ